MPRLQDPLDRDTQVDGGCRPVLALAGAVYVVDAVADQEDQPIGQLLPPDRLWIAAKCLAPPRHLARSIDEHLPMGHMEQVRLRQREPLLEPLRRSLPADHIAEKAAHRLNADATAIVPVVVDW